ncbi:MAG: hypothetical protein QF473_22760 [Planctomycetota bacterium]|nr:hypothetical protein [Planctomycetota bacterium]
MPFLSLLTIPLSLLTTTPAGEFILGPPDAKAGGVRPAMVGPGMDDLHRFHIPAADKAVPPRSPVNREVYFEALKKWKHHGTRRPVYESFFDIGPMGVYAPRHTFAAAVIFKGTGERRFGERVKEQLKRFHGVLKKQVEEKGMNYWYMHYPVLLEIQYRILKEGNILTAEDEKWWRDLVLTNCRTIHVWGTAPTYWRGPMHRSQGEGVMKRMAALKYPDVPEAKQWMTYADTVWQDWWQFRDNAINDTGYFFGMMFPVALGAELMGKTEVFTDPGMKPFWERLLHSVSPDGAVFPYGAHGGWNSGAHELMWLFELVARHTKDGRFRWVAHRLFNYIQYQSDRLQINHMTTHFTKLGIALAWLFADDSIKPVPPGPKSMVTWRKETLRVRGKDGASAYYKNLDPADDKAQICCGLIVTDKVKPHKLIFRSGWDPGDLFMLVDLFPHHEPMNPGGILGISRFGSALTMSVTSKAVTDWHNMLMVEDLSGTAAIRSNENPNTIDSFRMEVTVPVLSEHKLVTHAVTQTTDFIGFPMKNEREFLFVKNRFVVVRDRAQFEESFLARLGPTWFAENIGPQIGPNWANTFIMTPRAHGQALLNPPWDLLIVHSPKPDRELVIRPRHATKYQLRYTSTENLIRYRWQGVVKKDDIVQFSQILLPHAPTRKPAETAKGVQFVRDDLEATILKVATDKSRKEWVGLNRQGKMIELEGLKTDAKVFYLDVVGGQTKRFFAQDATVLTLGAAELIQGEKRVTSEKE